MNGERLSEVNLVYLILELTFRLRDETDALRSAICAVPCQHFLSSRCPSLFCDNILHIFEQMPYLIQKCFFPYREGFI